MGPHTRHISNLHPILKKFCIYLNSQGIRYKIVPDFYVRHFGIRIVNSRYSFRVRQTLHGKSLILTRFKDDFYDKPFNSMPTREDMIL